MSSGGRKIIENSRERIISPDVNRLESFLDAQAAEAARRLFVPGDPANALEQRVEAGNGALTLSNAVNTPLNGAILDGLMVLIPAGGSSLIVTPGMVLLNDPDGQAGSSDPNPPNSDDSSGKMVVDPDGVTAASGALPFLANPGPGNRIDIVEVRRIPSQILETDNRDIFDPSTGTSAPALVNKVTAGRLTYRIRRGTVGGGLPANVQGWLPLFISITEVGAVNFDGTTGYDVRPLVRDRGDGFPNYSRFLFPTKVERQLYVDAVTVPGGRFLNGVAGSHIRGHRAGGLISWVASPGTAGSANTLNIDLADPVNRQPGLALAANAIFYLWLAFPGGLPRWVRYSTASIFGVRVPQGMRGIPTVTNIPPTDAGGISPAFAFPSMPSSSGLDGPTPANDGVLIAAFPTDGVPRVAAFMARDSQLSFGSDTTDLTTLPVLAAPAAVAASAIEDDYTITAGTHYPRSAKRIKVFVKTRFLDATPGDVISYFDQVRFADPTNANWQFVEESRNKLFATITAFAAVDVSFTRWIDLPVLNGGGFHKLRVFWNQALEFGAGAVTRDITQSQLIVFGWEL